MAEFGKQQSAVSHPVCEPGAVGTDTLALASGPDIHWTETFETALRSLGAGAPRTAVDG